MNVRPIPVSHRMEQLGIHLRIPKRRLPQFCVGRPEVRQSRVLRDSGLLCEFAVARPGAHSDLP